MNTLEKKLKQIAIYDNGGKTLDRYTIVLLNTKRKLSVIWYDCIGSCATGNSVFMHSNCNRGRHLGKRVDFKELTPELQKKLEAYLND